MIYSYPWYFRDWRASDARATMTLAERGLYREILDLCYENGSVTSDEKELAKLIGCSLKSLRNGIKSVAKHLQVLPSGDYSHPKVLESLPDIIRLKESRSNKAKLAASARWQNKKEKLLGSSKNAPSNANGNAPSMKPKNAPSNAPECLVTVTVTDKNNTVALFTVVEGLWPDQLTDWDCQNFLSQVDDSTAELFVSNLRLWLQTRKWRDGYRPSFENYCKKGTWKTKPAADQFSTNGSHPPLDPAPDAADLIARIKRGEA